MRIARYHQHLRNAWAESSWQHKMWIACFYIGPGLSEIRHQTPDGQEARKPVKKGSIHTTHHLKSMLLGSTECWTIHYVHWAGPQSQSQSRSQSPAHSPVSPASPT